MATIHKLVSERTTSPSFPYTTASFTPNADDLIVVVYGLPGETKVPTITDSEQGATRPYEKEFHSSDAAVGGLTPQAATTISADIVSVQVATRRSSGVATTVSLAVTGASGAGLHVDVYAVRGLPAGRNGFWAVRQWKNVSDSAAGGTPSLTFTSAYSSANPILGVVLSADITDETAPAGFTEHTDNGIVTPTSALHVSSIDSGHGSSTVTWGSAFGTAFAAIIIEFNTTDPYVAGNHRARLIFANDSTTGGASWLATTASTADDELLVATMLATDASGLSFSDNASGTWQAAGGGAFNASASQVAGFVRTPKSDGETMAFTTAASAGTRTGYAAVILGVVGVSRVGSSASRQNPGSYNIVGASNPTVTMDANTLTTSLLLGYVGTAGANPAAIGPPTDWTEVVDGGYSTPTTGHEAAFVHSGVVSGSIAWTSARSLHGALVIEIDTTAPPTPTPAALVTAKFAPTIVLGTVLKPANAALSTSGLAPTIRLNKFAVPSTLALVTTGLAPTVTGGQTTFGSANFTLANATTTAAGAPVVDGDAASALSSVTTDGDGAPIVNGSANITLESVLVEAYGGNGANITLENAAAAASGSPVVSGAGATTTANTVTASGAPVVTGSGVPTLADAGGAASGSGIIDGTIAAPLDNATASAAGTLVVRGSASVTLAGASSAAAGAPVVAGSAGVALANATSVGVGFPVYDLHLLSAALASPTSLVLTYDTPPQLSIQSAEPSDWDIVSASGAAIEVTAVEVVGLTVVLTTTEHTDGASYTAISSRNVYSVSGHRVLGPFNADYTGDGVIPTVTRVQCLDANTLRVFFSENMRDEDLVDAARYVIAGASGDPLYAVPVALSVTKLTDNNVDVTTTELVRGETYDLTVTVRDRGLNAVA